MAKQNKPLTPAEMQRANDKMMEEIGKMKFESIEEVQAFINQNINGKILSNPSIKKKGPKSNIEKSEDLYYKALEAPSLKKAQTLLNQALELNPENVVAITKLGELCENIEDAIEYFKNAMEIGAKCLGEEFFEKERGHFWGWHHTRPYMTAKLNYAEALSITGKNTEAIENFMEMLELNPNDNQGVRYLLSTLLLTEKKWGDFLKLYNEYDEDSAYLNYNYLFYLLAREGASSRARKAYLAAKKSNIHIINFLSGKSELTGIIPEYYSPGDESEAELYLAQSGELWVYNKKVMPSLYDIHFNPRR